MRAPTENYSRKVKIADGTRPQDDRFISLTTTRLLATDLYLVAVVDGTNRLADPRSLLTTTDLNRARRHANRLTESWGGVVDQPDLGDFLPRRLARLSSERQQPITTSGIEPPRRTRDGRWAVRWQVQGHRRRHGKRFDTEHEAQDYYNHLTKGNHR